MSDFMHDHNRRKPYCQTYLCRRPPGRRFCTMWCSVEELPKRSKTTPGCCCCSQTDSSGFDSAWDVFLLYQTKKIVWMSVLFLSYCLLYGLSAQFLQVMLQSSASRVVLLLTVYANFCSLEFNPVVELVSPALVTCSAAFGDVIHVEGNGDGVAAELRTRRVRGDCSIPGVQPS